MKLSFILFSFFFSLILPFEKIYAYSSSEYLSKLTASIRDQYQIQENAKSKIKRCFDEKVKQSWSNHGSLAVIVYESRMDFWNTKCELVGTIYFGVPYIRADQNISFNGQPNKLNHCYSNRPGEKPYEVTFYLEDVNEYDGFEYQSITRVVWYSKVYQPPNSYKEEGTIKRFIYDRDWEVPYAHYNTFDKKFYESKCGMYSF